MRSGRAVLFAIVLLAPLAAQGHGGGLDGLGCHHNRKAGGYHCHRGKLADQTFETKEDALKALGTDQQQTQPQQCCRVCKKGKPCGNSCIAVSKTCRQPPGCAC